MGSYLERMRKAREKVVVVEAKIHRIRSSSKHSIIFVVEGKCDIAPYEVWLKRIDQELDFRLLPANGKQQVLDSALAAASGNEPVWSRVYFIVDKDFDGVRQVTDTSKLFCTDRYCFENYLVSEVVLQSILHDEFECVDEPNDCDSAVELFRSVIGRFIDAIAEVNLRLYMASTYGIRVEGKENKLSRFVSIGLDAVVARYTQDSLGQLIPLEREPTPEEAAECLRQFSELASPLESYRGKYFYEFFLCWVDLLAEDRRNNRPKVFSKACAIKFSRNSMTHRNLAARSSYPALLPEFVRSIKADLQMA